MPTTRPAAKLELVPVGGPERRTFGIDANGPALVGRTEACAVFLPDPSVSREHCMIRRLGDRWMVTDLGSRNGTFLNSTRIESEHPTPTEVGDFVRIGVYTFRMSLEGSDTKRTTRTDGGGSPNTIVERVGEREIHSMAHKRLELLIDGAAAIQQASSEEGLARAIVELVLAGSGYRRAAVLRGAEPWDEVELLAARDLTAPGTDGFTLSRSLIREAGAGHVARLCSVRDDLEQNWGQSIERLHIHSALCAPIVVDSNVVGAVYLDARGSEDRAYGDAVGFCHAVARLAGLALSNLKRAELEQRQKHLERDLEAAQQAQSFLWPHNEGTVGPVRFALRAHPGRVIAGDLFDIFPIDDDRVGFCMGDVTGQGMGAAILMTAVQATLRAALARHGEPAAAVQEVNRYIVERSAAHMFATLWVAIFDGREGILHYVDAGHGHWLSCLQGQALAPGPRPGGPMIGIDASFTYAATDQLLRPGDRVVLYSDGIVEHRGADGEQFGRERLMQVIADAGDPGEDVASAMAALTAFIGERGLEDDTTIASIEVL